MRILFFHFHLLTLSTTFLFLNSVSIRGESIAEKVHHNLAPIAQILQEDPSGNTAQKALNNVFLPYDFQSYFYQLGVSNEAYRKWFGHDREIKSIQATAIPNSSPVVSTDQPTSSAIPITAPGKITLVQNP